MQQRKTRMHFGPGGPAFGMITALILAVAMYTQANLLFGAFGIMLGGLVVSYLWAWYTLGHITVNRISPSHGVVGEPMAVRYDITNHSRLPVFSIIVTENWGNSFRGWKKHGPLAEKPPRLAGRPFGWIFHLGPKQRLQAEAPCWPIHRGRLSLDKIVIASGFPFGLIRRTVMLDQPDHVLVFPRIYRMNRRVLSQLATVEPAAQEQIQRGGGTEEFFGLREYRAGDSLRSIDWKHSARTGRMIAREMTQPSPPRMMVLLDLREAPGYQPGPQGALSLADLRERAVSLAASLFCDAYLKGYQLGLAVLGPPCPVHPPRHSRHHRTKLLTALAELDVHFDHISIPSVIPDITVEIRLRGSGALRAGPEATVLTAESMAAYVGGMQTDAPALASSARPLPKRAAIAAGPSLREGN